MFVDDNGVRWHSWKESNGRDYDTYTYPCSSSEQNFAAYRKQSLAAAKKRVEEARGRLAVFEGIEQEIKDAKHVIQICQVVERLREI